MNLAEGGSQSETYSNNMTHRKTFKNIVNSLHKLFDINKKVQPVFVVGSPRSGTSVLTWSLGQHPNLFATEESNWISNFSLSASIAHAVGSSRGERSQLSANCVEYSTFLETLGEAINAIIMDSINASIESANRMATLNPDLVHDTLKLSNKSHKKNDGLMGRQNIFYRYQRY